MKRLSKAHWARIQEALDACNQETGNLGIVIEEYNTAMDKAKGEVQITVDAYHEKLAELKAIYEELAGDAQNYYDERTEKWQEGDAGTEYAEWISQLENPDNMDEELDIEFPDELPLPDMPDFTDTSWLPPEAPGEG